MEHLGLGKKITSLQHRDAIHIAVAPVVAGQGLKPGNSIQLVDGKAFLDFLGRGIGVVDPFLKESINAGDKFWLYLNPGSITSLRHEWTHCAFEIENPIAMASLQERVKESTIWLTQFAVMMDLTLEQLLEGTAAELNDGLFVYGGESLNRSETVPPAFWEHYELVQDCKVPQKERPDYFSCSC